MDLKVTRQVGKTALQVPKVGLGTAPLGTLYQTISDEQAIATMRAGLDGGLSFIDTAPYYGAGLAEQRLGTALAGATRDNLVLSTKVGRLVTPDGQTPFDFSRDGVLRSVEASLKRLQVDRVDILLIHDPDAHYEAALNEAFPTLAELRSQGVIKAIGAGMNQWQMLADFARHADFDCFLLAGRYTLLDQSALAEFLPLCQERNIAIFAGGVFNSGILATGPKAGAKFNYKDASPEVLARAEGLARVCARHGVPLAVAAVQFPLAHPAITTILLGAASPTEVQTNLANLDVAIPPALWAELKAEGLLAEDVPTPQG